MFVFDGNYLELFHDVLPPSFVVEQSTLPHLFGFNV
jgi:hypothetical protein